ncbi:hypothetical protein ACWD0J_07650 [Streptomyces sp. NPDC003011]
MQHSKRRTLRTMLAALGATAAAVALSTGPATASDARFPTPRGAGATAPASAAAGCWGTGPTVTDYYGHTFTTQYCHNYQAGNVVRANQSSPTINSGYLYAGDNWFACQAQLSWENPPVGNARNNWWLWTQGDVGYSEGGWGWFPATKVSGGGNYEPIPALDYCVF